MKTNFDRDWMTAQQRRVLRLGYKRLRQGGTHITLHAMSKQDARWFINQTIKLWDETYSRRKGTLIS